MSASGVEYRKMGLSFGKDRHCFGLAGIVAVLFLVVAGAVLAGEFGQPARFEQGRSIEVGGIAIEFLGRRHVSHPVFKPGFTFHDFRVGSGRESEIVSWSSGTGDIAPARFTLAGKSYVLELKASVAQKGWLKDDELVLWTEKEFLEANERRSR